jgi:hypothetical protein
MISSNPQQEHSFFFLKKKQLQKQNKTKEEPQ